MNSMIKKNVCAECTSVKKKGERYEKKKHEVFSLLLAASMTVPQLADYSQLSGLTVVHAAVNEEVSEKAVTEVWRHFTSGATNDNGQKPAVLKNTNKDAIDPAGGEISLVLKTSQDSALNRVQICHIG